MSTTPRATACARTVVLAFATTLVSAPTLCAQNPNPTNLWVADIRWEKGQLVIGKPTKLTKDNGSNSQPAFTPDGRAIVFSAQRDTGSNAKSDIYRIDLATGVETRVTNTSENENSPTVNAAGEYVAVRWENETLFKKYGVWVYTAAGAPIRGVLREPDTTGYYTPLPNGNYALTRPKSKSFTIGIFDAKSGTITDIDSGVPALPPQIIPGENALSYVRVDSVDAHHVIRRFDIASNKTQTFGSTIVGRTSHAWIAGHRTLVMAKGNRLFARTVADTTWRVVATFDDPDLRSATAYVVSPRGDKLILTSPKRLAFATVLRDSLDVGRTGAEVAAMAIAMRDGGKLGELVVVEGGVSALGDDRLQKKRNADALALHTLAITMFPSSHRAYSRLGDAQRTTGDTTAAMVSYKKSLELNPRATDADKSAATAVEKKIAGQVP